MSAVAVALIIGLAAVSDGDTLRIGETRVRLYGIDAPEGKQTCERDGLPWLCGQESGKWLRELVAGQPLTCQPKNLDRYGRTVAICTLPDGRDVAQEAVSAGMALAYRKYGGALYDAQEAQARADKRGLWAGAFKAPWDYRSHK